MNAKSVPSNNGARKTSLPADGWLWIANKVARMLLKLGRLESSVYLAMALYADSSRRCNPSLATLAKMCAADKRSILRATKKLEAMCLIEIHRQTDSSGRRCSNSYFLLPLRDGDTTTPRGDDQVTPEHHPNGRVQVTFGANNQVTPEHQEQESVKNKKRERAPASAVGVPSGLLELIDGWNALDSSIVKSGNGASREPPAQAVLKGWLRAQKDREHREHFQDIPEILAACRAANFCHGQGWFRLSWLFVKGRDGEFNIAKLISGAYESGGSRNGHQQLTGPGQRFDPTANGRDPKVGTF